MICVHRGVSDTLQAPSAPLIATDSSAHNSVMYPFSHAPLERSAYLQTTTGRMFQRALRKKFSLSLFSSKDYADMLLTSFPSK